MIVTNDFPEADNEFVIYFLLSSYISQDYWRKHMAVTDVIRESDNEFVIYFLLSSYINAARHGDKVKNLPEQAVALPVTSKKDVRTRFDALMFALDAASKRMDDEACVVLKDALIVFCTALARLQSLDARQSTPLQHGIAVGVETTVRQMAQPDSAPTHRREEYRV